MTVLRIATCDDTRSLWWRVPTSRDPKNSSPRSHRIVANSLQMTVLRIATCDDTRSLWWRVPTSRDPKNSSPRPHRIDASTLQKLEKHVGLLFRIIRWPQNDTQFESTVTGKRVVNANLRGSKNRQMHTFRRFLGKKCVLCLPWSVSLHTAL